MNEPLKSNPATIEPEAEIVQLAKRILKVYGSVEDGVLDAEIRRMASLLGIPIEEVLGHGE